MPPFKATSLDHYREVSLYETAFKRRREDIAFFTDLADKKGGPILEYGAGTGRITLPLARRGHEVTAVDASPFMLERLCAHVARAPRKTQDQIQVVRGDMRAYRTKRRYPLVLATFNVVGHLQTYIDLQRFLKRAREHLAPRGTLAFDVLLPQADELEADPTETFPAPRFKHPDSGAWIRQTERFEYDPEKQLLLIESEFREEHSRDSLSVPLVLRQWFPKEIEAALLYEGFRAIETFADYTEKPGLLAQNSLVFVVRAR
jgi:SAM-dependent methyltransferase